MRRSKPPQLAAALAALLLLAGIPGSAAADAHDPQRAGHPLRILAYALHPIGVLLDYAVMRPCHWLGHREPLRTLFGHDD